MTGIQLSARAQRPHSVVLRPHFSLLARTLELVHGDKQVLNDLYILVVRVRGIEYPNLEALSDGFDAVLKARNMQHTLDSFYSGFLTSVVDIMRRGYPTAEAFARALDLYMNPRAAAIFSRLRKLMRAMRALKMAWWAHAQLEPTNAYKASLSTYLPSPSPSSSPAVSRGSVRGRAASRPSPSPRLGYQVSVTRTPSRRPPMLTAMSDAVIELNDRRIMRSALRSLVTAYEDRLHTLRRQALHRASKERTQYIECIIKQRDVHYTLQQAFTTWRRKMHHFSKLHKSARRSHKNFIMINSLLTRFSVSPSDFFGADGRERTVRAALSTLFHIMLGRFQTLQSMAAAADRHYKDWHGRFLKRWALRSMTTRYHELHNRLLNPYKYIESRPAEPTKSSTQPMCTIASRNLMLRALREWRSRLQSLKDSYTLMIRVRDKLLVSIAFVRWRKAHGYNILFDCFAKNDNIKIMSRAFSAWRQRHIMFVAVTNNSSLQVKDQQLQQVVLSDLHRKVVYAESLGSSFGTILQNRRLIRILRDWRYALLLHRMERITATRHNLELMRRSLFAWRGELEAYRFGVLIDRPYNCARSYFIKASVGKQKPTYANLALLALGAMIGDMRPEILEQCPTLKTIKKIVGLSDYYRHDARPLRYLKDVDKSQIHAQLAPDNRRHILAHCFKRWYLFGLMEADKHKNQRYLEIKQRRKVLAKAFAAIKQAVKHSLQLARVGEIFENKQMHKVLASWRRALMEKRVVEHLAEQHNAALVRRTFNAWKIRASMANALSLFAVTLPGYNKELYDEIIEMLYNHEDPEKIAEYIRSVLNGSSNCPQHIKDALEDFLQLGRRGTLLAKHAVNELKERNVVRQLVDYRRQLTQIFNAWRNACEVRCARNAIAEEFYQDHLLQRSFRAWHTLFSMFREARTLEIVDSMVRMKTLRRAFGTWQMLVERLQSNDSVVSDYYLLLRTWRSLQFGRELLWFKARREDATRYKYISIWKKETDDQLILQQLLSEKFLKRRSLRSWHQRLQRLQAAEALIAARYGYFILAAGFYNWRDFTRSVIAVAQRKEDTWRGLLALKMLRNLIQARCRGCESIQRACDRERCRMTLQALCIARKDRLSDRIADEYVEERNLDTISKAFVALMNAYRERRAWLTFFEKLFYFRIFRREVRKEMHRHTLQAVWVERMLLKMAFCTWREERMVVQTLRARYILRIWHTRVNIVTEGVLALQTQQHLLCMRNAYTAMLARQQHLQECFNHLFERYRLDLCARILAAWQQAKVLNQHYDTQQRTRFYRLVRRWKRRARENAIYRVQEMRALSWHNKKLLFHAFSEMKVLALINIEGLDLS